MENLLKGYKGVSVYLDNILITGSNQRNLYKVLETLASAGIMLNLAKCAFMLCKVEYLGHIIEEHGLYKKKLKL